MFSLGGCGKSVCAVRACFDCGPLCSWKRRDARGGGGQRMFQRMFRNAWFITGYWVPALLCNCSSPNHFLHIHFNAQTSLLIVVLLFFVVL